MTGRIPSFANLRLDASVVVTETPLNARQRRQSGSTNFNNNNREEYRHHEQLHGAVQVHRDGRPRNRHHRLPANMVFDEGIAVARAEPDVHPPHVAGLGSLFRQNWLLPIHEDESQRLSVALSWVASRFRHTDKLSKKLHRDLLGAVAVIIDCELYRLSTYTTYVNTPMGAIPLANSTHQHHHHHHNHHRKHEITAQNRISGLEIIVASKVNARRLDHHAAGAENGMDGSVLDLVRRKYPGLEKNKQVEVSIEQVGRWADTATVLNFVRMGSNETQDPIALLFSRIDLVSILGSLPLPN